MVTLWQHCVHTCDTQRVAKRCSYEIIGKQLNNECLNHQGIDGMAKSQDVHNKPIAGLHVLPFRETGLRDFGLYPLWAFCISLKKSFMKKYLPFVIKYLPDILIQGGIAVMVIYFYKECEIYNANWGRCVGYGPDFEILFGVLLITFGTNIIVRRYFSSRNSGK